MFLFFLGDLRKFLSVASDLHQGKARTQNGLGRDGYQLMFFNSVKVTYLRPMLNLSRQSLDVFILLAWQ